MPCVPFKSSDGRIIGIACSRGKRKKQVCYICGEPSTVLCDHPGCDKPMCRKHAYSIGPDNDVCNEHYNVLAINKAKDRRKEMDDFVHGLFDDK